MRMLTVILAGAALATSARAEESAEELAKKLANPVAALISVPFQLNYDTDIGPTEGGDRWLMNVQPVVPIGLNERWNLISRTILPIVSQEDVFPGAGSQSASATSSRAPSSLPKPRPREGGSGAPARFSCSPPARRIS